MFQIPPSHPPRLHPRGGNRLKEPSLLFRSEAPILKHQFGHEAERVESDVFRMPSHVRVEGLQRMDALREIVPNEGGGGIEGIASGCGMKACR